MIRTFEFDDYPLSGRRLIRELDNLKSEFPNFKASVFAIPGAMTRQQWRPLLKRKDWIETCPHGIVHQKRECRDPQTYMLRKLWIDHILADKKYTRLFKAPWHGLDKQFAEILVDANYEFCMGYLDFRFPVPTPDWKVWSLKDARTKCGDVGRHVEAHAIIPNRHRWHNRRFQQIDRRNIKRFTETWSKDDEWEFVSKLTAPMCKKVYLGCGSHVYDGYDCLDMRSDLDPRIIHWEAPDRLPYMPNRVDVVLTAHVFNYFADEWYQPIIDEIFRILRPGGLVRMQEDATDSGYIWRRPGEGSRGTGEIRSLPTRRKIHRALKKAGFDVKLKRPGRTSSPHRDILQADNRLKRWQKGHKFILEGTKPAHLEPQPEEPLGRRTLLTRVR